MKGHSTTSVYCKSSKSLVEIDARIAYMCKLLWELGLKTNSSCENYHDMGYVWIEFAGQKSLTKFLQIVLSNELMEKQSDVTVRALGGVLESESQTESHPHIRQVSFENGVSACHKFNMPRGGKQWGYSVTPLVFAPPPKNKVLALDILASVFIPVSDYNFVCDKLKQHIKRKTIL